MLQIVIVASLFALAIGFAVVSSRTLQRAQGDETALRHGFLAAFDGRGVPAEILVHTFEALHRRQSPPPRPIGPATRLQQELGLSALDVEDVALLVAARSQARIPHAHDLDALDAGVRTVGELVDFLVPFYEPAASAA